MRGYLRNNMAKKKDKIVNASAARVRVAPKRRAAKPLGATKATAKRSAHRPLPPKKGFDAMKWCGVLPELAGDSLAIQRQMRDEW